MNIKKTKKIEIGIKCCERKIVNCKKTHFYFSTHPLKWAFPIFSNITPPYPGLPFSTHLNISILVTFKPNITLLSQKEIKLILLSVEYEVYYAGEN